MRWKATRTGGWWVWWCATLVGGVGAALGGCEEGTNVAPSPTPTAPATASGATLRFADEGPLLLDPGALAALSVRLSPPGPAPVRFALLDDPADASLDRGLAPADAQGVASAQLRAPRRAASFRVRASLDDGASVERLVTVLQGSTGLLRVTALYTGKRSVGAWQAALVPVGDGCDGSIEGAALSASGELPLTLAEVPSGQRYKLRLRAGDVVAGCSEIEPLDAGESRSVEVLIKNTTARPSEGGLALRLGVVPESTAWSKTLGAWSDRFRGAYLGGQSDDPQAARALLDTMVVLAAPADRAALLVARDEHLWDDLLSARFAQAQGPALALSWLSEARERLRVAPGEIRGELRTDASASFTPEVALRLGPGDAVTSKPVAWKLDVDDTFQVSGELNFWPTRLLGKVAEGVAAGSTEAAPGAALTQLLEATGCQGVGEQLAASAPAALSCGAACLRDLCAASIGVMWSRAQSTDEATGATASLSFTASGAAQLDEQVRVVGFLGSWAGSLQDIQIAGALTPLSGPARAEAMP